MGDIELTAHDIGKTAFPVAEDGATSFKLRCLQRHTLELDGCHFHFDSDVLLPIYQDPSGELPMRPGITSLSVLAKCLSHAKETGQKLIVTGHADTVGDSSYNVSLSHKRADNVLYLLQGKRDDWAQSCMAKNKTEDVQQILAWVAQSRGWDCDPGKIDNTPGGATTDATKKFQTRYNQDYNASIPTNGTVAKETWGAFFDLYTDEIKDCLDTDDAGLQTYRSSLQFLSPADAGCGKSFPIEEANRDQFNSKTNRRVELIFFDAGDEPQLKCHPNASSCSPKDCQIFDPRLYEVDIIDADIVEQGLKITKVDPQFAPGAEKLSISYTVSEKARAHPIKIGIEATNYKGTTVFEHELTDDEKGDGEQTFEWDGTCSVGDRKDRLATPLMAPYKVVLFRGDHPARRDEKPFKILYHSVVVAFGVHTPDGNPPPETDRVKFAQFRLNVLGYDAGPVNGTLGTTGQKALKRFQRAHYVPGTKTILTESGNLDDDTFNALKAATPREIWQKGKDPLTEDARYYVEDDYYSDHPINAQTMVTTTQPQFQSGDRLGHVDDLMDRPFIPIEAEVKLQDKSGNPVSAPGAVGAVTVAFEMDDGPEDEIVDATKNALGRKYVKNARQFGTSGSGAARIDAHGDNCLHSLGGFRKASQADDVKSWFPDAADSKLAPFKVKGYGQETRDGKAFHRALVDCWDDAKDAPDRRGRAGLYFRFSMKSGDDAKIRAALTFEGQKNKDDLVKAHDAVKATLAKEAGRWTVWRKSRLNAYVPQGAPTRASGSPNFATVRDGWQDAFYEFENDGQPIKTFQYSEIVDAATFKAAIANMPAGYRPTGVSGPNDVNYSPTCMYGGPALTQNPPNAATGAPAETAADFVTRYIANAWSWLQGGNHQGVFDTVNAILGVIHDKVRETQPEGLIVFDFKMIDPISGQDWDPTANGGAGGWVPTSDPTAQNRTTAFRGWVQANGAVNMNVDNTFDVNCYVLHECGHARFLYHWKTDSATAAHHAHDNGEMPNDHDHDQERCTMSYNIEPDQDVDWKYPFCGKCIMKLRGWKHTLLPQRYTV